MRRLFSGSLVALALLAASVAPAEAQFPLSFNVGPTFANLSGDDADDLDSKIGFFAAVGTAIPLDGTFSIGPNLAYVQKGAEYPAGGELALDYVEIPVFLNADFPTGDNASFGFGVGPQVAFNVGCEDGGIDCSDSDSLNGTEFGIVANGHFGFPLSETVDLSFGAGGDFGLTDVTDTSSFSTSTYFLSAGLNMALGG